MNTIHDMIIHVGLGTLEDGSMELLKFVILIPITQILKQLK